MAISKVVFGNKTLIDLTSDTVTPETLLFERTCLDKSGNQIAGKLADGFPKTITIDGHTYERM